MKTINLIGLEQQKVAEITTHLNVLLANFQVHYQNLRGLHWNIKGKRFFDLHLKFEEYYNDSQIKIDLIAERILTLGETPLHTFEDYLTNNTLSINKNISNDEAAIGLIINSLSKLIILERHILELADDANDEGTNSMMSDFIAEQEKTLWMLKAWLS